MLLVRGVAGLRGVSSSSLSYLKVCSLRQQLRCGPSLLPHSNLHHAASQHPNWLTIRLVPQRGSGRCANSPATSRHMVSSFLPSFMFVRRLCSTLDPAIITKKNYSRILFSNMYGKISPPNSRRLMYNDIPGREIPDYLQEIISEVDSIENNLFVDNLENELYNDMEDDIIDFLTPRLISYEEVESSFLIPCPLRSKPQADQADLLSDDISEDSETNTSSLDSTSPHIDSATSQLDSTPLPTTSIHHHSTTPHHCSATPHSQTITPNYDITPHPDAATTPSIQTHEMFIDKNTGHYVCPWCNRDGSWESLMGLLNMSEEGLTTEQLHAYLASTLPITHLTHSALSQSPLAGVSRGTLEKFGCRVTSDESRVVFPVGNKTGDVVGFHSVSLLHPIPQIIRRFVSGESCAFVCPGGKVGRQVVFVSTCCDVLALAQHNIYAIALPSNDVISLEELLGYGGVREVLMWYRGDPPPRHLLMALIQEGPTAAIVQSKENDSPIYTKSESELKASMKHTIPLLSEFTTTFYQLKDQIYHRLTHKEETCGVQWQRFSELNDILLGHRPGELTVLTGPTGSGKTTFMAEFSLDLCVKGVRTLWGSFEVSVVRLCEVMLQQYTGAPLPHDLSTFTTIASQFSTLPLHFLTYHGQQDVNSVIKVMNEAVDVWGVEHVVIDNLQFLLGSHHDSSIDRFWQQDLAVTAFRHFATSRNCHVTLIAHPKKVPDGQPLSIGSVFGGAKLTQEADNVLILQVKEGSTLNNSRKLLQVVKNRYGGQLGMLPLKFHQESLTLSSCFRQKSTKPRTNKETNTSQDYSDDGMNIRNLRFKTVKPQHS